MSDLCYGDLRPGDVLTYTWGGERRVFFLICVQANDFTWARFIIDNNLCQTKIVIERNDLTLRVNTWLWPGVRKLV